MKEHQRAFDHYSSVLASQLGLWLHNQDPANERHDKGSKRSLCYIIRVLRLNWNRFSLASGGFAGYVWQGQQHGSWSNHSERETTKKTFCILLPQWKAKTEEAISQYLIRCWEWFWFGFLNKWNPKAMQHIQIKQDVPVQEQPSGNIMFIRIEISQIILSAIVQWGVLF